MSFPSLMDQVPYTPTNLYALVKNIICCVIQVCVLTLFVLCLYLVVNPLEKTEWFYNLLCCAFFLFFYV